MPGLQERCVSATNRGNVMFDKQIQFIDSFTRIVNDEIRASIEAFGFVIKDYITNKQLYRQGVDGKGKKLRGYTRTTIRIKMATGRPSDRTTLFQEGDFYASIQIDAYEDSFEIRTNVSYDKYLLDPAESRNAYGYDAIRPSNDNMTDFFQKYVIPNLRKKAQNAIRGA